jgi:hypothetical protein
VIFARHKEREKRHKARKLGLNLLAICCSVKAELVESPAGIQFRSSTKGN